MPFPITNARFEAVMKAAERSGLLNDKNRRTINTEKGLIQIESWDWPLSQAFLAASPALAGDPSALARPPSGCSSCNPRSPRPAATFARGRLGAEVESELFRRGLALAGVALN
jgi:hypothetical protein